MAVVAAHAARLVRDRVEIRVFPLLLCLQLDIHLELARPLALLLHLELAAQRLQWLFQNQRAARHLVLNRFCGRSYFLVPSLAVLHGQEVHLVSRGTAEVRARQVLNCIHVGQLSVLQINLKLLHH